MNSATQNQQCKKIKIQARFHSPIVFFISFLIIGGLLSCNNDISSSAVVDKNCYTISTASFENDVISDPSLKTEIIKLESNKKEQLIGHIDKIVYMNNKFYILDSKIAKAIYVFDRKGQFEYRIKRRGLGPGEYNECWDMDVDGQGNVYIMDVNLAKVIQYDSRGEYVKEATFTFTSFNFCRVAIDTFALFQMNRVHTASELNKNILYWTTGGYMTQSYFPYKEGYDEGISLKPSYFQRTANSVLFSQNFSDTIYEITPQHLKAKYIFTPKESDYYAKSFQIDEPAKRSAYLNKADVPWNFHNYFENETKMVCSFYYKMNVGVLVFDKQSKKTQYYIFSDIKDAATKGYKPYTLCDNKIVGFIHPSSFNKLKGTHFVNQLQLPDSEFENTEKIKILNPYLVLYDFE